MLEYLKSMLGIADDTLDSKLNFIISGATARLKLRLGGIEPPEEMDHIIVDLAIKRYNRIGSEGLASHTVEGETMNFTDSDFAEFEEEIQAFLDGQKDSHKGKVRFI